MYHVCFFSFLYLDFILFYFFFFSVGIAFLFQLYRHSQVGALKARTKSSREALGAKFSRDPSYA